MISWPARSANDMPASARSAADEGDEVDEVDEVADVPDDLVDDVAGVDGNELVDDDDLVDDGAVAVLAGRVLDDPAPDDVQALSAPPASATMRQAPTVVRLTPPIGEISPAP